MSDNKINRKQITEVEVHAAIEVLAAKLKSRLAHRGWGTFTSKHEVLGVINEEVYELTEAVHEGNPDGYDICSELMDIAVGAVFGYASIKSGKVEGRISPTQQPYLKS